MDDQKMMNQSESDTPDNNLVSATVVIMHAMDDWFNLVGRQWGPLSRPQRRMLLSLEKESDAEPIRVSDLVDVLDVTPAGVTRMLDKLESQGYLTRYRLPELDQRQVYVKPTAEGRRVLALANQALLQIIQERVRLLTSEERATFTALFAKMLFPE